MNKTVNGRYEDKKSVSLRLFLVLCIFLYRSSGRKYLFTCGSGSSRVSVGEGYFYFNADMKFGVENDSVRMVSDFVTLMGRQTVLYLAL